jgi:hypothetical protein
MFLTVLIVFNLSEFVENLFCSYNLPYSSAKCFFCKKNNAKTLKVSNRKIYFSDNSERIFALPVLFLERKVQSCLSQQTPILEEFCSSQPAKEMNKEVKNADFK